MEHLIAGKFLYLNKIGLFVINNISRPLEPFWWVGPLMIFLFWVVVPIQRQRHNALGQGLQTPQMRLWWAPGWSFLGLVGVGFTLMLYPRLAEHWDPLAWFGISFRHSVITICGLVLAGALLILLGFKGYIGAWLEDRRLRYKAFRWRLGTSSPETRECSPTSKPHRTIRQGPPDVI